MACWLWLFVDERWFQSDGSGRPEVAGAKRPKERSVSSPSVQIHVASADAAPACAPSLVMNRVVAGSGLALDGTPIGLCLTYDGGLRIDDAAGNGA